MPVTVHSTVPATWDTRLDNLNPRQLCKIAQEGASAVQPSVSIAQDAILADLIAKRQSMGWDFDVSCKLTAAETGIAIDLTAAGVTFPAGSQRIIDVEGYVSGQAADETGTFRYTFTISGGTTPIIRAGTLFTATPNAMQVGGIYQAVAGAGLAATPMLTATLATNNVLINVVSAEAEILNFFLRIKVGRLQPMLLGI